MLGIETSGEKTVVKCGKGTVGVIRDAGAAALLSKQGGDAVREFYSQVLGFAGIKAEYKNYLRVKRGCYEVVAVLDESVSDEPLVLNGLYADMFTPDFSVVSGKVIQPGENALLLDLNENTDLVIGTSCRIYSLRVDYDKAVLTAKGAGELSAKIRLRLPFVPAGARLNGKEISAEYESAGGTLLLSYNSDGEEAEITVYS
jgi:hypothetical protein